MDAATDSMEVSNMSKTELINHLQSLIEYAKDNIDWSCDLDEDDQIWLDDITCCEQCIELIKQHM